MKNETKGYLRMLSHHNLDPVNYELIIADYHNKDKKKANDEYSQSIKLNQLLGQIFEFDFSGEIRCLDCGAITKKSFNQGSCYKCFIGLASNDICIVRPEQCHYHMGTCREPNWGEKNCFKTHKVYLAYTGGIKVGITKENPITKRWVDQGAIKALPLFEVNSRINAGRVEVEFSKFVSDKTSWQKMLQTNVVDVSLIEKRDELLSQIKGIDQWISKELKEDTITEIKYPQLENPNKIKSLNPEKIPKFSSKLLGVKGQYLIFDAGVLNCRTYAGYGVIVHY
jgi:hypothetical protein